MKNIFFIIMFLFLIVTLLFLSGVMDALTGAATNGNNVKTALSIFKGLPEVIAVR